MEVRDLTPHGYPGYQIREDGWLISPTGRLIGGNANRQVRLPLSSGGSEWRGIAWLLATAFVPQPPGYLYVRMLDGDPNNLHCSNVAWSPYPMKGGRKQAKILQLISEGWEVKDIAAHVGATEQYVRQVAARRARALEAFAEDQINLAKLE